MIAEGWIIGMEFVETNSSWNDARDITIITSPWSTKCRLGVIVPKEHAMTARLRMLEFNQRWPFYYQVYSYDARAI